MITGKTEMLGAREVKNLLVGVYRKYRTGEITSEKAYKEVFILNSILKAVEVADLESRLQNIEGLLRNGN